MILMMTKEIGIYVLYAYYVTSKQHMVKKKYFLHQATAVIT